MMDVTAVFAAFSFSTAQYSTLQDFYCNRVTWMNGNVSATAVGPTMTVSGEVGPSMKRSLQSTVGSKLGSVPSDLRNSKASNVARQQQNKGSGTLQQQEGLCLSQQQQHSTNASIAELLRCQRSNAAMIAASCDTVHREAYEALASIEMTVTRLYPSTICFIEDIRQVFITIRLSMYEYRIASKSVDLRLRDEY
jgi:hypothetical protein